MDHSALTTAVEKAGGQAALARLVGVSQPSVWHWVHRSRRVPAEFVLPVESATGVSRHDLRPDLYPTPVAFGTAPVTCNACTRASAGDVAACTAVACPMRQVELQAEAA